MTQIIFSGESSQSNPEPSDPMDLNLIYIIILVVVILLLASFIVFGSMRVYSE